MKNFLALAFTFWVQLHLWAAPPRDMDRRLCISGTTTEIRFDTLSVVPGSFSISGPDGLPLDSAFFGVDFISSRLNLRVPEFWASDSVCLEYRVWPIDFSAPIFARDTSLVRLPGPGESTLFVPVTGFTPHQGLLNFEGLQSSGSITRGLAMGNRQDPVLNSTMNLQLNGRLTDEISILAVVSDQNIPFQPDGSTQQLQDFDKIFIQLEGYDGSLIAGDFEISRPSGYFMNFTRKSRGAMLDWKGGEADTTVLGGGKLTVKAAGAISRGKYARNRFNGQEGNQGPYRLAGNDNESFILILAGTERVYLDGRLLQRGMDHDYIIDYNTAEITFMPRILINRNSRITAEFEYSERNFVRSMMFTGANIDYHRASIRINFFQEQDHQNQPLFQEISPERRSIMAAVGDSLHKAFDLNFDSTGFRNDRVMYRITDTLGFERIFVFSTDPEKAVFQPGFSFTGRGNGNYVQVSSSANGRVFQWVAPVDGMPQGTHEPIIRLVTPKKHQMLTLGGRIDLSPKIQSQWEYAFTNRDLNRFSELHKEDNSGHAFRIKTLGNFGGSEPDAWLLNTAFRYELVNATFDPVERHRSVEFERDWNLEGIAIGSAQHLPSVSVTAKKMNIGHTTYTMNSLLAGEGYQGIMNELSGNMGIGKNNLHYHAALLNSKGIRSTDFYRHQIGYSRNLGFVVPGVEHHIENNRIRVTGSDTLSRLSESFNQIEFFLTNTPGSVNPYRAFVRYREDNLPEGVDFSLAAHSREYGLQYGFLRNPSQRINLQIVYRDLHIDVPSFEGESNEKTINARGDYFSRWFGGLITSNLFYETASGRERKREFIYVEVPAGQGVYVWNDYNGNEIMELDEFEISPFPEEANFIRVFIPTTDYVPVNTTSVSQTLNFEPSAIWRNATGFRGVLGRFSNRLNYRISNKKQGGLQPENFNPFTIDINDSLLISVNAVVRNSLFFNRIHPKYGLEWTHTANRNKILMNNGFESRITGADIVRLRYNINNLTTLNLMGEMGRRTNESEFFARRNYMISYYAAEPSLSYQPTPMRRYSLFYVWQYQDNISGNEELQMHRLALEGRFSSPSRGNINLRYQVSGVTFPFDPNTPLAFEMLQGQREGINHQWNINWQQNLNSYLQLSLLYNGRKPLEIPAIHTGTVQLRALF